MIGSIAIQNSVFEVGKVALPATVHGHRKHAMNGRSLKAHPGVANNTSVSFQQAATIDKEINSSAY